MIVAQGKIVFAHTYPSKADKQKNLNRTKNPQKTLQYNIHEEWGVGKEFFSHLSSRYSSSGGLSLIGR